MKLQLLILFIKVFKYRIIDTNEFFSRINTRYIYYFIAYYKKHIKSYVVIINRIYYYYGLFIYLLSLAFILRSDLVIIATLDKDCKNKSTS